MLGFLVALLTALAWAGSSTILKSLATKIDTLSINILRLWTGSAVVVAFVLLSGRGDGFVATAVPLLYVIASGVIAMVIGDTAYIKSLALLDVSQAFPIAQCIFPLLTVLVAASLLEEPFTWSVGVGAIMVVLGVYLVAAAGTGTKTQSATGRINGKGVVLALGAAIAWTVGAAALKIGAAHMDSFVVTAIRIPASGVVLTGFVLSQNRRETLRFREYGFRNMALAAAAGVLAYGIGGVAYVMAIQLIGVGKAVLLIAIAPLFILPFSIFVLKEKPTRYTIAGVFVSVAGVFMVSL
jgi:drug/metabolite transporter (DMT)-like permease